jgi:hypothetical protein
MSALILRRLAGMGRGCVKAVVPSKAHSNFGQSRIMRFRSYDVTHAYNPKGEWTYQHLMSVNGRFKNITRDDLLAVADRYQIARATRMLADVKEAVSAWPDFARQAGVSKPDTDRVRADHSLL